MMAAPSTSLRTLYLLFALAMGLNFALWWITSTMQPKWPNVPPAPSQALAPLSGLGDKQFAYRLLAFPLQQWGNDGGLFTPLKDYRYDRLGHWFMALDAQDPVSNYVPYLASYYFGGTQDPEHQLRPVIDYLARAGSHSAGYKKWRWLAQAVYLAKFKYKDAPLSLDLAYKLAALPEDMPHWAHQMPAIISADMGDKETALRMMNSILSDMLKDKDKVEPQEINFVVDFICNRIYTPIEARQQKICDLLPKVK
jgi:hypothetical protein